MVFVRMFIFQTCLSWILEDASIEGPAYSSYWFNRHLDRMRTATMAVCNNVNGIERLFLETLGIGNEIDGHWKLRRG